MNDFDGLLATDYGFKPQGKSAPMAASKGSSGANAGNLNFDLGSRGTPRSTRNSNSFGGSFKGDRASIFGSSDDRNNQDTDGFWDLVGGPARYTSKPEGRGADSSFNLDSMYRVSSDTGSKYMSSPPVFDKPVYDDDIFEGVPGLKSSGKVKYEDVFASVASEKEPSSANTGGGGANSPFDDLLGGFGKVERQSKVSGKKRAGKDEKGVSEFDDLLPGFGSGRSPSTTTSRPNSDATMSSEASAGSAKRTSTVANDPFKVFESVSTHQDPSPAQIVDPLEEISKLSGSGSRKYDSPSLSNGKVYDDVDPFDGLGKSVPAFSSVRNNRKDRSPSRTARNPTGGDSAEKSAIRSPKRRSRYKTHVDDDREFSKASFNDPMYSSDNISKDSNVNVDINPEHEENLESNGDVWLVVSEIPLFTQPTAAPPPSRPPPPRPVQVSKSVSGSAANANTRRKGQDYVPKSPPASAQVSMASPFDNDYATVRSHGNDDEHTKGVSGEELNSVAAAMKEAMDRAEAKFRYAREVRERESTKGSRRENVQLERDEKALQEDREKQEKVEHERMQKEREEKEKEQKRLERERERARELEKERERARQAVERATREARERAAAEARVRAGRAAVEEINSIARQHMQRAPVEKVNDEAGQHMAKALVEEINAIARQHMQRAPVEKVNDEAGQRTTRALVEEINAIARQHMQRAPVEKVNDEAGQRATRALVEEINAIARQHMQRAHIEKVDDEAGQHATRALVEEINAIARQHMQRAPVEKVNDEAGQRAARAAVEELNATARQYMERAAVEKVNAEARQRAGSSAVEKVNAEARQRAERAAVQRAQAEARERAAAVAKERAEKAAADSRERANTEKDKEARERAAAAARAEAEARVRAERAAVERAAAEARERAGTEARERAAAAASKMNQQTNDNDLESFFSMNSRPSSVPRPRTNSSDSAFDNPFLSKQEPNAAKKSAEASSSMRKAPSAVNIVDDLSSIFGAAPSSGEFQEVEGENEERRRARLERHQRAHERVAKALAEKNERDLQNQREQAERHRIAETLDTEIKRWAAGKEGNLRALLSTLQYVLWPECRWQPVSLTDLITGVSVKKVYRKATLCIHPDKVQQKGATLQQKYIAEKVFDLLKEAWNKFNSEELF